MIAQRPSWLICLHCGRSVETVAEIITHDGVMVRMGLPSKLERRWVGRWSRGHVGPLWHTTADPNSFYVTKLIHEGVTTQ